MIKAEAREHGLKICSDKFQSCLIYQDFEASEQEEVQVPGCIKKYLSNLPEQRPPEAKERKERSANDEVQVQQNSSLAKPLSAVQKSSLFEGELPKNPQRQSISRNGKGSHTITKSELKGSQAGSLLGGVRSKELPTLTKTEKVILYLISEEFLTTKQIAIRRKCSTSIIHRHERNLRKKGVLNRANQAVHKSQSTYEPSAESDPRQPHAEGGAVHEKQKRLHGQEFNAGILYKDERYKKKIGQVMIIDGNTVRCYRDSIEVYSGQSFFADDVQKATAKSMEYWARFLVRLENDLKIILVKPRAQNIKLVNQHYAEVGNELAIECEMKGDKVRIYANDDGKLWFTIDNSFNLREAETLHPQTAKEDMQDVIVPFFNDLRDKKPPMLSEMMDALDKTVRIHQETASGLKIIVTAVETILNNQVPKEPDEKQENPVPKEKNKPSDLGGIYQ